MSFSPTGFRPYAKSGWGGRAEFRGAESTERAWTTLPAAQTTGFTGRGQVGTVVSRNPGISVNRALVGVSRDSGGAALGSCTVELYHGKRIIASTVSDASGNFQFDNPGSGPFRIIADKAGVAGVTAETLIAV